MSAESSTRRGLQVWLGVVSVSAMVANVWLVTTATGVSSAVAASLTAIVATASFFGAMA